MEQEPLPQDLADLLGSERRAPPEPAARARVAARLATSLAMLPHDAPVARATSPVSRAFRAGPLAIAATFVLGAASGAAAMLVLRPSDHARVLEAPVPPSTASRPAAPVPSVTRIPPAPPIVASAAPSSTARPAASTSSIALEQAILDTARVALGREDAAAALAATATHARRFPRGQLSEEREAIAIQALVLLHRDADAHARADAFAHAYPDSALMPAIQEALGSLP